jgi:hypothetical protein
MAQYTTTADMQQGAAVAYHVGAENTRYLQTVNVFTMQSDVVTTYYSRQSICIGTTLIFCTVISIICNIVDVSPIDGFERSFTWGMIGHGFWVGVLVSSILL